ncbi:MAG: hypothetical protein R2824_23190 [Saprospiraceae bacterium]
MDYFKNLTAESLRRIRADFLLRGLPQPSFGYEKTISQQPASSVIIWRRSSDQSAMPSPTSVPLSSRRSIKGGGDASPFYLEIMIGALPEQ